MNLTRIIAAAVIFVAGTGSAEPLFTSDAVFPPDTFASSHGASLVELSNGNILATWFSGREETDTKSAVYGAEWDKDTQTWSEPRIIVPSDYVKLLGNTALFRDDDGIVWLFFAAVRIGGWSAANVDYVQSRDDGKTWSGGRTLVWFPGNLPRNPPVRVGDHRMLMPLYYDIVAELGLVGSYTFLISYRDGKILKKQFASIDDRNALQPALAPLGDGRILLLARDKAERFIHRAISTDNGQTWGPADATSLPNPGSGIAAVHIEELNATLVAYNHSTERRNPLSLAVSTDGGRTFRRIADLEYRPGDPDAAFSYPALLKTGDWIHAIWSHEKRTTLKHVRFNLDWLRERMRTGHR